MRSKASYWRRTIEKDIREQRNLIEKISNTEVLNYLIGIHYSPPKNILVTKQCLSVRRESKVCISFKDVEEQEKREFLAMKRKVTRLQAKIDRKSKQLDEYEKTKTPMKRKLSRAKERKTEPRRKLVWITLVIL